MRDFALIVLLLTISSFNLQEKPSIQCEELKKAIGYKIFAGGLIDHNELEIEWIKEEVNRDDLTNWIESYMLETWFSNLKMDENNRKHLNEEVEYSHSKFEKMLQKAKDGDKLYYYSTPESYWKSLAGQDGVILIRRCRIIGVVILTQS